MTDLLDRIRHARETGDFKGLLDVIPYAGFLGVRVDTSSGELVGMLPYSEHLVGNSHLPALHGGVLGALLEMTAIFTLLWRAETLRIPKTINITVEYLRSGRPDDTYARAEIFRQGRRVANVRAVAWQADPERPITAAHAHFLLAPAGGEATS